MRTGLYAISVVSLVALAACSGEAPPPAGPDFEAEPPVVEEEDDDPALAGTLMEALGTFGTCMNLEAWMRSGVYMLHEAQTDDVDGQALTCSACHTDGSGGQKLSANIVDTFDSHRAFPAVMRLVTGTVNARGNFEDLVPSNRYTAKGIESCPPEELNPCHPPYELQPEVETAVTDFVSFTLERWRTQTCDLPFVEEE